MSILVDDVGSFPLPASVDRYAFNRARCLACQTVAKGKAIARDARVERNFSKVVVDSFKMKLASGLEVVNYPQHYDMHEQFAEAIREATNQGTYLVDEKKALIPEILVLKEAAKTIHEETGKRVRLRACITGPMELYLKEIGTTAYEDVLLMFAETVRRFATNSLLNLKYIKTEALSLDEPSFGFQEVAANRDTTSRVLERAFDIKGITRQIHLHSPSRITDLLEVDDIDVLALECAATPKNMEIVTKKMLDESDKRIRVGISRTDIDGITAELHEKDLTTPAPDELVDKVETIRSRFEVAQKRFGDRLAFVGPDCGLGGWSNQKVAQLLLRRTVRAVKASS
jgi:5-methyltetrahydropteroyltriglutamate--homocysteine methyltransferase